MTENTSHRSGEERQALIEERLRTRAEQTSDIRRRLGSGPAPLSAAQKRIWLLHQFDPGSPVWNRPLAVRLVGELDRHALARAVNEIVRRHEVLRTVFEVEDGEPRQTVLPPAQLPLEFEDLRGLALPERESRAAQLAAEESLRTFDLATGPMLRMKLLQLDARDHVLLVLMHHIAFDGWSETVFLDELRVLYRAYADRRDSPLPKTPIQYADFAIWQEQRWREGTVDRQVQYWRKQLAGEPAMLALPADGEPSESERYRGESRSIVLSSELTEQLKQFSRQERVSLFMTLLMTFQLLLARHADQEEVAVGVPVAGRTRVETEKLIGCFMNVLVFRANFSADPKVRELLAQTRQSALEAFANQEVPFERLVEDLRPERRSDRWPMFQAMFQLRNLPPSRIGEAGNLKLEPFEFDRGVNAGLDLSLEIQETASGLRCSMLYRLGLFAGATIERMLDRFRNLLEAVVRDPDRRIWALPMLSEAERHRLLVEWNDTRADFPRDACIHQLVERQAEKTPEAIAVTSKTGSLTYGELNCRANQVANHLRNLGVRPETLVGICVERSLEMVVGLLGILKAGGAYVPLDPSHPSHLLASLIANARLQILLTKREAAKNLPAPVKHLVYLDADWPELSRESERNPNTNVRFDNLAYVLYTSGSTGSPKGVMVCHASVCNHLFWQESHFPRGDTVRLLQKTPYAFDVSVWEVFGPLMTGGRLVLAEQGRESDNDYLIGIIVEHRITTICFIPSQLDIFLQDPRVKECTSLRCVVTAGEVLPPHVHDRFFSLLEAKLYNGYGPTEATVICTCFDCERERRWVTVPIGRPVANTQIYIVDRYLQPVPVGVRGELCVAGAGVARGYLNRPELTAEKFLPDPFSRVPGARLYRTGDLARYLPDGNIEFLGRVDAQVKIRGARVELGEVEAALSSHPDVRAAAVVARDSERGDKQLVAYVVVRQQVSPTIKQLRAFVGSRLPAYMQPARWVFLDAMPLSSSGKINRAALPEPADRRLAEVADYRAPRSPIEETMASIWARTFSLDPVGIRDDFFELGGHSLLAVSLFARIKREFGIALPLSALLEAPTVEQLSRLVAGRKRDRRRSSLIPIRTEGTRLPLFCIHAGNGRVLMYGGLARHLGADQPVYALQSPGIDGGEQPLERVERMASRYLAEIREVQPHGPYHLVGFCLGAIIAFEMARQLVAGGEELGLLAVVSHDAGWRDDSPLGADLKRHLASLRRLERLQWPVYLARRLRYRATRLRSAAAELLCSLYNLAGQPLPSRLRELHVGELNHRAGLAYEPRPASLLLHYFQGSEDLHKEGAAFWASIATAGVNVHIVPGWGSRMFREPNVRTLAEKLAASQNVYSGVPTAGSDGSPPAPTSCSSG